ncbi:hypothetical protein CEXT_407271 [Caerostris extrusa]|uniref:Uncharacterized protein n=1 Tax=Caerostris extrusa TaxID=172846 RepID=A0AAV4NMK7_CAEEX|nr:hypothetical protein CEXT_407271 [Caerostris extrusa]
MNVISRKGNFSCIDGPLRFFSTAPRTNVSSFSPTDFLANFNISSIRLRVTSWKQRFFFLACQGGMLGKKRDKRKLDYFCFRFFRRTSPASIDHCVSFSHAPRANVSSFSPTDFLANFYISAVRLRVSSWKRRFFSWQAERNVGKSHNQKVFEKLLLPQNDLWGRRGHRGKGVASVQIMSQKHAVSQPLYNGLKRKPGQFLLEYSLSSSHSLSVE